jgi:putative transposase
MLREFYRRRLPHIIPIGATFFVTFRLHGSIPKAVLEKLARKRDDALEKLFFNDDLTETDRQQAEVAIERQYWIEFNDTLDTIKEGPHHLGIPELAQIVVDRLKVFDGQHYNLCCYVVMSNHVHALLDFSVQLQNSEGKVNEHTYKQLDKVMNLVKGSSAKFCNDWLRGQQMATFNPFWEHESHDRFMRNERHHQITVTYILNNPVKVGICKNWQDFPFAYVARP